MQAEDGSFITENWARLPKKSVQLVNSVFYTTYVSEQEYGHLEPHQKMTYPDGEVVNYHYNRAGGLYSIDGQKAGNDYSYVSKLGYDEFEAKVYLKYGNGTEMNYAFDDQRRRLKLLQATTTVGKPPLNNSYNYDAVSNITELSTTVRPLGCNTATPTKSTATITCTAHLALPGRYEGIKDTATYGLEMQYDNLSNIINKKLSYRDTTKNYQQASMYGGTAPHQPTRIGNKKSSYDLNGNLTAFGSSEYFWDEENRLMAVLDSGLPSEYTFTDAGGERVIKSNGGIAGTWLNGAPVKSINHSDNYTVYVSPILVCRKSSFTKHIYMEAERIVSKIGIAVLPTFPFSAVGPYGGGSHCTIQRTAQLKQDRVNYYATR